MNEKPTSARDTLEFKQETMRQVKDGRAASVVVTPEQARATVMDWIGFYNHSPAAHAQSACRLLVA